MKKIKPAQSPEFCLISGVSSSVDDLNESRQKEALVGRTRHREDDNTVSPPGWGESNEI